MTSAIHRYVDKVFVLSLPAEENKRERMRRLLSEYGISFEFFDAINGNSARFDREWHAYAERPLATQNEKMKMSKLITSRGAWGYLKSGIALIRRIMDEGHQRVLILEDDIFLARDFESRIVHFFDQAPSDWKLLFLGASQGQWEDQEIHEGYYYPTPMRTNGTFAVAYDRSILRDLLMEVLKMESNYDKEPMSSIMTQYPRQCLVAYPNMVMADVSKSTIRHARDVAQHAQKVRWQLDLFDLAQ